MEYKKVKLSECCKSISDGDHLPPPKSQSGVPFITISNIDGDNQINFNGTMFVPDSYYDSLSEEKKARIGDILYSVVGSFGKPVFIDFDKRFVFQRHIAILKPNDKVNSRYLYYVMLNPDFYYIADKMAIGAAQRTITLNSLRNMTVNLHDIAMQNAIVDVLSCIDKKIQCNNKINDNLQHQLKLMYDYWFTQFDFPDENGKPYRASGGAMVWNEQLKCKTPQNWKVSTVSDCVDKISTGLNPRDNFVLGNGDIRYITVKNLTATGSLDFSGCDTIDEDARAIVHRRSDISAGDILFASIAPLGRCYLIQQDPVDWDINESVFSIRSKTDTVTPEFMYLYFQSDSFIQKATNTSTGSIFKGIRINTLLDTALIVPELQVCKSFTDAVKSLLAEINNNSSETAKLTALRDWLLPMLMNGQATIAH